MSRLVFRNVDVSPEDPVSQWPLEAVQTALERGGLSHWRRLAKAVREQPWGPVARKLEEALGYSRPYGVAEVMERTIARARAEAEASEREEVAAEVKRLMAASGLSRADFAARIGASPSRLSTYATGKVVPSAALLVRMRRNASRSPWQEAESRPAHTQVGVEETPDPNLGALPSRAGRPDGLS